MTERAAHAHKWQHSTPVVAVVHRGQIMTRVAEHVGHNLLPGEQMAAGAAIGGRDETIPSLAVVAGVDDAQRCHFIAETFSYNLSVVAMLWKRNVDSKRRSRGTVRFNPP